jgi:hypothetical protein
MPERFLRGALAQADRQPLLLKVSSRETALLVSEKAYLSAQGNMQKTDFTVATAGKDSVLYFF